jgi:hypothetical protein
MALYLKEVALLETTTNTLVKLTNVMEGVENGAVFGYQTELISIKVNANQTEQVVTRHTFDIVVKDDATPATQAILTAWANNPELRFKASGYSGDTFFLWDEPVPIVFSRQYDLIGARHLIMTLDAVSGYNGASGSKKLPVYAGQNLLGIYNVLAGNGAVLNGFTPNNLVADGTSGANQTIIADAGGVDVSNIDSALLFFPFNNVILTFSCNIVSLTDIAYIGYGYYDVDGVVISSDYSTADSTLVGRLFVNKPVLTDATTCFFKIGISTVDTETVVFNTPAIRLGYETAFTN